MSTHIKLLLTCKQNQKPVCVTYSDTENRYDLTSSMTGYIHPVVSKEKAISTGPAAASS